jgi:FAD/FMN-containing dehydrogenase
MLVAPAGKPGSPASTAPGTVLPSNDVSELLARRLKAETRGEVMFDSASRGRYATDASIYQIMPVGVLVPRTESDITTALAIARDLKVPVLPRGGGTSQCGQTTGAALVIDSTKYFRKVLGVDVEARTATVEPGLVLDHLNATLKPHGLWYPVDVSTSAQATLGGMAGNNSCGSRSIAYGNMVHNVLGMRAWLSDGAELDFGSAPSSRHWRASTAAKSPTSGPRSCVASRATTSTSSTIRASDRTPKTGASTWRIFWSARKARWRIPGA